MVDFIQDYTNQIPIEYIHTLTCMLAIYITYSAYMYIKDEDEGDWPCL